MNASTTNTGESASPTLTGTLTFPHAGKIIELLLRALPYPDQMKNIAIGTDNVRFDWRDQRYLVTDSGDVDEVRGGCLVGTDRAILMRKCIDAVKAYDAAAEARKVAA